MIAPIYCWEGTILGLGMLFDMLAVLSVLLWLIRLAQQGVIGPETVAVVLIGVTICAGVARASGMSFIVLVFRAGVPLAALATFAFMNTDGSMPQMMALLGSALAVLIAVFGIYVMFANVFRHDRPRRR